MPVGRQALLLLYIVYLLHQQLCDLDSIGGSALTDLVAAAPQADAVFISQVRTDPANKDDVLIGSLQRHGILFIGQIIHRRQPGAFAMT